jgi:hypothetical protein
MKRLFLILLLGVFTLPMMSFMDASESELIEISDILKEVESNNTPEAIGDGGLALGVLQIHEGVVIDVNRHYGTNFTHLDAKNPEIAQDLFVKYISLGIKLYELKCGHRPSEDEIVRMWNGGIYRGYEYEDTVPYLKKYKNYKKLIRSRTVNS